LKRIPITVLILGLLTIVLHAPMIGWGLPYATAPDRTKTFATDEILPLEALAEMRNTFVESRPDRNYGYPWWHYFVVASAQAPYVAYLLISGGLNPSTPEFPFGLSDPVRTLQTLTLIGRFVTVLMSAGVVVAAYYFSRVLWGHLTGVVAAILTMLNYLMFYYSRTGNLDVPTFFWSCLGMVVFANILVEGFTPRRALWLGVFAGLAIATKDQAVTIFLPFACVLLLPKFNRPGDSKYRLKPLLVGLGASVIAYLISTGMVVDPDRHITHVHKMFFTMERLVGPEANVTAYFPKSPRTMAGAAGLAGEYIRGLVATVSLPVLLTSLVGVLLAFRTSPRRLVLLLPVLALFFMVTLPMGISVRRYHLPLTLLFDGFAAVAIVTLSRSTFRWAWVPLLVGLCGWRLLIGVDLTYAQYRDTRYDASEWFAAHARPGDRVEYFGSAQKLPHLSADIESRRVGEFQDAARNANWKAHVRSVSSVLRYLENEGPEYVLIIPDWTSLPGMVRSQDCPPEIYDALTNGTAGFTQVVLYPTRTLLPGPLCRPSLDNPSVCPPVAIFARNDLLKRTGHKPLRWKVDTNSTGDEDP
jgi:hypothetical protein